MPEGALAVKDGALAIRGADAELKLEDVRSMLEEFFVERGAQVQDAADSDVPVYTVDLSELNRYDADLATYALSRPQTFIAAAIEASSCEDRKDLIIRIGDPRTIRQKPVAVSKLRVTHAGKFVCVPGIVAQLSDVGFQIAEAAFRCVRCGSVIRETQEGTAFREPLECYEDQGGCKRSAGATKFVLVPEDSVWRNVQRVEIQELPEETEGRMPSKMPVVIHGDDLVGRLRGGNRAVFWGVLWVEQGRDREKRTTFDKFLEVHGFEVRDEEAMQLEVKKKDREKIEEMAKDPDIYKTLAASIAPHIHGYEVEKLAIVYQMAGGVAGGPRRRDWRGDIHQILLGDPATAKSQLLIAATALVHGPLITMTETSHKGLTAWAEQINVFGAIRWTFEAGAMPLADKAPLLGLDELDKMKPEDRRMINPALDPQEFSISKAGGTVMMVSRVPVLAAANPKYGRFEEHKNISEQFDVSPDTLSRFDMIWPIIDRPEREWDSKVADAHLEENGHAIPPMDPILFRKYIVQAKKVAPTLSPGAKSAIKEWYVEQRGHVWEASGAVALTPRQLGAVRRIAQASAKLQLRGVVTIEDAVRAIQIMSAWLERIGMSGEMGDLDVITTGISHSQRQTMITLRDILRELAGSEGTADLEDIVALAQQKGIEKEAVERTLAKWKQEGEVYSPSEGKYRVVTRL